MHSINIVLLLTMLTVRNELGGSCSVAVLIVALVHHIRWTQLPLRSIFNGIRIVCFLLWHYFLYSFYLGIQVQAAVLVFASYL